MRISDWSSDVCSSDLGGVAALAAAPDQFTMMKNDRSLIPALVEECVRWTSPLLSFMRTAARDYTLRDQSIRKADWLMLSYHSAHRDEDVVEQPLVFQTNHPQHPQTEFVSDPQLPPGPPSVPP